MLIGLPPHDPALPALRRAGVDGRHASLAVPGRLGAGSATPAASGNTFPPAGVTFYTHATPKTKGSAS